MLRSSFRDFLRLIVDLPDGTCVLQAYAPVIAQSVARSAWMMTIAEAQCAPLDWSALFNTDHDPPNYIRMHSADVLDQPNLSSREADLARLLDLDAYHHALKAFASLVQTALMPITLQRNRYKTLLEVAEHHVEILDQERKRLLEDKATLLVVLTPMAGLIAIQAFRHLALLGSRGLVAADESDAAKRFSLIELRSEAQPVSDRSVSLGAE